MVDGLVRLAVMVLLAELVVLEWWLVVVFVFGFGLVLGLV
jgi:hypothetical protein